MTGPDPDEDLDVALENLIGTAGRDVRVEHVVRLDFPGGHTDHIPVEAAHLAAVLAHAIRRDLGQLGTRVVATALEQTWVLVDETEITSPIPEGPQ